MKYTNIYYKEIELHLWNTTAADAVGAGEPTENSKPSATAKKSIPTEGNCHQKNIYPLLLLYGK